MGKDDLLGSTSISVIGILQSQVLGDLDQGTNLFQGFSDKWFVLEGCKSGEVQISVQCLATISRDSSKPASVVSSKPASIASSKPTSKEPSRAPSIKSVDIIAEEDLIAPGKITLTMHRAKKLEKKVKQGPTANLTFLFEGMFGKADPYARVTLGNQQARSQTINNNQVKVEQNKTSSNGPAPTHSNAARVLSGTGRPPWRWTPWSQRTSSSR